MDEADIQQFPLGEPVLFRDGDIVTSPDIKVVYVISNGQKRRITSADVFNNLGYNWNNIIYTNLKSIEIHPEGEPLTLE